MNTREAAKKWGVDVGTVSGWCRDGWIESAQRDERGFWRLDPEALRPHRFNVKKQTRYIDRVALVLMALSYRKTIPRSKLQSDGEELARMFGELLELKFVAARTGRAEDIFTCYMMTLKGEAFLSTRSGIRKIAHDLEPLLKRFNVGISLK